MVDTPFGRACEYTKNDRIQTTIEYFTILQLVNYKRKRMVHKAAYKLLGTLWVRANILRATYSFRSTPGISGQRAKYWEVWKGIKYPTRKREIVGDRF